MKTSSKDHLRRAMLKKLAESCLDENDAKRLHFKIYTAQEIREQVPALYPARDAFEIPYFDPQGGPTGFSRYRYFALNPDHPQRYNQEKGTLNEVYLAPYVKWEPIFQDVSKDLLITEGELKGACAAKHGFNCIGLGGVSMFMAKKRGKLFLDQLEQIEWKGRRVSICYDGDAKNNPNVIAAENALARKLVQRGASVWICRIPQLLAEGKTGLDDYIRLKGAESFRTEVLKMASEWQGRKELCEMNEEVVYVKNPGIVMRLANLQPMRVQQEFIGHAYANRKFTALVGEGEKKKPKDFSTARVWNEWPHRAEVERVVYEPGAPRITEKHELNTWPGWKVEPKKGSIQLWRKLLDDLFLSAPEHRKWFEQWLAYPLRYPGTKLMQACVFWSHAKGLGKGALGSSIGRIYGDNFTVIGDRELTGSSFNQWARHRQFVLGDEITGGGAKKKDIGDMLKNLISQEDIWINPKNIPQYSIRNCINYYFNTNHHDAFYLEDKDRRFFIHEVRAEIKSDEWWKQYFRWLDDEGGAAALFYHLLHYDLTGFEPKGHAPNTAAKNAMREACSGALRAWVSRLRDSPEEVLRGMCGELLQRTLETAEGLLAMYNRQNPGTKEENRQTMANTLRHEGFRQAIPHGTDNDKIHLDDKRYCAIWYIGPEPQPEWKNAGEIRLLYQTEHNIDPVSEAVKREVEHIGRKGMVELAKSGKLGPDARSAAIEAEKLSKNLAAVKKKTAK